MAEADRIKCLRFALLVVGLIFILGLWPLTIFWPLVGFGIQAVAQSILK